MNDTDFEKLAEKLVDSHLASQDNVAALRTTMKPGDVIIDGKVFRPVETKLNQCPFCQAKGGRKTVVEGVYKCRKCTSYFGKDYQCEMPKSGGLARIWALTKKIKEDKRNAKKI